MLTYEELSRKEEEVREVGEDLLQDSAAFLPSFRKEQNSILISSDPMTTEASSVQCESVLESIDSCVGCVEGVDIQHDFEEQLPTMELTESSLIPPPYQSLTASETTLIRLSLMDHQSAPSAATTPSSISTLPDLDVLNLCGSEDDASTPHTVHYQNHPGSRPGDLWSNSGRKDPWTRSNSIMNHHHHHTLTNTGDSPRCAICLDPHVLPVVELPCCQGQNLDPTQVDQAWSSRSICLTCILILTLPVSWDSKNHQDGALRMGRCPCCRSWLQWTGPPGAISEEGRDHCHTDGRSTRDTATGEVDPLDMMARGGKNSGKWVAFVLQESGMCSICNQEKETLVHDSICDACFLGRQVPLLYECESCQATQRIPHPMYRYQPSPQQFGPVKWTCQGPCGGTFTTWRLLPDQAALIPVADIPLEWGGPDWILETARNKVAQVRWQQQQQQQQLEQEQQQPVVFQDHRPLADAGCQIL